MRRFRRGILAGGPLVLLAVMGLVLAGCDAQETEVTRPVGEPLLEEGPETELDAEEVETRGVGGTMGRISPETAEEGELTRYSLAYPTGEKDTSALLIEKITPREVRANQPYEYQIRVTNLTDQPLTGVTVLESFPPGLQIERAQPQAQITSFGQQGQQQGQGEQQRQQQQRPQAQQQQQGQGGTQGQQQRDQAQQQQQDQQDQAQQPDGQQMGQGGTEGQQQPDQAQQQDQQDQAQQPDGQQMGQGGTQGQQSQGGQQAQQQQQGRQGQAGQQAQQQRGGQAQQQDQQQVSGEVARWMIGELGPEETRTINVVAVPTQVGQVSSCLAATYEPTICATLQVVNPNLEVSMSRIDADARVAVEAEDAYLCDELVYQIVVRNVGTGTAKDVKVQSELPDGITSLEGDRVLLANVGDLPAGEDKAVVAKLQPTDPGQYTMRAMAVTAGDRAYSNRVQTRVVEPRLAVDVSHPQWQYVEQPITFNVTVRNTSDVAAREVVVEMEAPGISDDGAVREIGRLGANESRTIPVTIDPGYIDDAEQVQLVAQARSICARPASAQAMTQIRRIPALLLETVDTRDPVPVGESTMYTITVKNQGSAADENVQIRAELPDELQFENASGPTDVQVEGNQLTFSPIDSLPPGEVARWQIEVSAQKEGDVRFRSELSSNYLRQPVPSVEPTRVVGDGQGFGVGATGAGQQQQQQGQQRQQPGGQQQQRGQGGTQGQQQPQRGQQSPQGGQMQQ